MMHLIRRTRCLFCSLRKTYILKIALVLAFVIVAIHSNNIFSLFRRQLSFSSSVTFTTGSKQTVLLVVAIHSAPIRVDRRNAVRETWKSICDKNANVVCWFFTDGQDTHGKAFQGEIRSRLENENLLYGDMLFAQSPGGANFARRYLWLAEWATQRYNFQYIMYVDDDYFVCLDKLLGELNGHRPTHNFTWGWLHCHGKGLVYIDEGFLVISKDLINSFLRRKNSTLLCHPWTAIALSMWLNNATNVTTFGDNKRLLHHDGIFSKEEAKKRAEICHTYLGIHRSYPEEMRIYWNVYQKENKTITHKPPPITFPCHLPWGTNYKAFPAKWFAKPELCKNNPIWDRGEYFKGRQGT